MNHNLQLFIDCSGDEFGYTELTDKFWSELFVRILETENEDYIPLYFHDTGEYWDIDLYNCIIIEPVFYNNFVKRVYEIRFTDKEKYLCFSLDDIKKYLPNLLPKLFHATLEELEDAIQ